MSISIKSPQIAFMENGWKCGGRLSSIEEEEVGKAGETCEKIKNEKSESTFTSSYRTYSGVQHIHG